MTRRETQGLRYEFRDLVQRERIYGRNGLSRQEHVDLNARFERRDGEDRGDHRYDRRGY